MITWEAFLLGLDFTVNIIDRLMHNIRMWAFRALLLGVESADWR